jgi:signal peptidase II
LTGGGTHPEAAIAAWARMGALAAAVLALDQLTKAIVRAVVERGQPVDLILGFEIVNVRNPGIAFGLLDQGGALLLIVTAATLTILVAWFASGPTRPGLWIAVGLLVGGAIGNLTDRVREGKVTDFIDPPLWPAFNVADIAITFGVIAIVLLALFGDGAERDDGEGPGPGSDGAR